MRRSTPPESRPVPLGASLTEALRHIGVVAVVGMAVATVFTAWTPSTLLPAGVAEQISEAIRISRVEAVSTPAAVGAIATARLLPRIGIVAGHNGPQNDPGAVCPDGLTEAQVNRDIAVRVKAGLEANGFQVDLLDEFDPRLEGYEALAVVSIHNDSCVYINDQATGFKAARAVDSGIPAEADRLVACLVDRYIRRTGLTFHYGSVTPDMTQYHSFYEVRSTTPIAIIETGFLNLDYKILTEEPHRVAQGIVDGVLCYVLSEAVAPPASPAP